jgi:iron complex outermembrane receptor protein
MHWQQKNMAVISKLPLGVKMKMNMKKLSLAVMQALSAGVVFSLAAGGVQAQTQSIEKIEVTGSNIKRIEGESALPITVITRQDIERTGVTSAADLIDKLGLNSGASWNLSSGLGTSVQPGFSGASLRGLGQNNTLILLNGRRLANFAFNGSAVDLNSIPLGAVERVEILKDGASAIYGTDAIGGVINFILKNDYQGAEVSYYKTHTHRGGGNNDKWNVTGGFGDLNTQRFNVLLSYDQEKGDTISARSRAFASTGIRPDLGVVTISSRSYPPNFRWAGGPGLVNTSAVNGCAPQLGTYPADVGSPICIYDFTSGLNIYPEIDRKALVARGTFQLNAGNQLYAEYTQAKSAPTFEASETPMDGAFTPSGAPLIYPAGGRFYPAPFKLPDGTTVTPTGDLQLRWRGKDTGLRTDVIKGDATRAIVGAKGTLHAWDYDVGFAHAESKVEDDYTNGYVSEVRLRAAMLTGNVNPFTLTGQDAAGQALLEGTKIMVPVRISKATTDTFDFKTSKELMQLPAGPLGFAAGLESRKEKYHDEPQPIQSSGDIFGGGGAQPVVTADRTVSALFMELNAPIIKQLEATFAVRYDKYSDVGNTTNPKVGLRWTPEKSVLVRASYNTGFRAPSLVDLHQALYGGGATAGSHNDPIRCPNGVPIGPFVDEGNECGIQFNSIAGGNPNLKPEKSRQATLGIVLEPQAGTSLGADFFWIERKHSLNALGDVTLFDNYNQWNAAGYFVRWSRNPDGSCSQDLPGTPTPANVPCSIQTVIQQTLNLGRYVTAGVDVTGSLLVPVPVGKVKISFDGTYISKYQYQQQEGGPFNNNLGSFTSDNGAITRWRHILSINYSSGPWAATLSQNFVLGYHDDTSGGNVRDVGNAETYDLQALWTGIKNLTLTLGVRNVLDRDPPQSAQAQTFQVGYDPRYGDPFGRTYYGKITYSFK